MKRVAISPGELPWWFALGGYAAMYLPLYSWAAFSEYALWQNEDHAHGALVLLVLIWRSGECAPRSSPRRRDRHAA